MQVNKYGIKIRNDFSLCYTEWFNENIKKEQWQKLGKNTINYVNDNDKRHPSEQKPINIESNKENIPPPPKTFKYAPTPKAQLAQIEFDKKWSLPTQKRKTPKQRIEERNNKKHELKIRLAEVDDKIKLIKSK